MSWLTEPRRAWLYRISLAVIALLGIYGIVDEQQAAGWAALAVALLNTGLATANTSTKPPPYNPPSVDS